MITRKIIFYPFQFLDSIPAFCRLLQAPLFIIILATTLPINAFAIEENPHYQSSESLEKLVHDFVKQKVDQHLKNLQIAINPISDRLQLGKCLSPINLEDKTPDKFAGRMSFKLSCGDPEWKLYVTANIDGEVPVIIAVRGILRGATIKTSEVHLSYVPFRQARQGSMKHLKGVIGMRAKRGIAPNSIITVKMLQPPYLVFKNQPIKIVTYAGTVKVETEGVALESGTNQQQIPVRNTSSKKIIKGIVIAPNTVWVP